MTGNYVVAKDLSVQLYVHRVGLIFARDAERYPVLIGH